MPGSCPRAGPMVDVQIARHECGIVTSWKPCGRVPREELVEPGFEEFAYEDGRFPIGEGRGETRVRASLSPTFAGPDATAVCKL